MRVQLESGFRFSTVLAAFASVASVASVALTGCFADPPSGNALAPAPGTPGQSGPQGCLVSGSAPSTAPGGYYTNGSQVCTAAGEKHVFHGVDRPSFEWSTTGQNVSPGDFQSMASWHANVVRIALNQDFWLKDAALYDGGYAGNIDLAIAWAEQAGLDVILDLHWSDRGDKTLTQAGGTFPNSSQYVPADTAGYVVQQPMADVNSKEFWSEVADRYKGDGHVLFELYNEPNGINWDIWLNGGMTNGFLAVGMQELYDTVRATGAQNLVIAGGINWAFDLSGVGSHRINGYNLLYATHPYKQNDTQAQWATSFGYLAAQNIAPVIVTEFGDNRPTVCTGAWDQALITYAAASTLQISWTAWAWFVADPCTFPSLIANWRGTERTASGDVVYAALQSDPAPQSWIEAGAPDASSDASDASAGDASDASDASPATDAGADATLDDAADSAVDAGAVDSTTDTGSAAADSSIDAGAADSSDSDGAPADAGSD
jgi:aryl-phospho-beta-D-glucosidase BglC (GH1 family)